MKRAPSAAAFSFAVLAACGSGEGEPASRPTDGGAPPSAVGCGLEVKDCDLDALEPVPARCTRPSYEYAIADQIDQGGFAFDEVACDGKYLTLRVDLGSAVCPPEATKEERKECARRKVAFFVERADAWTLITYDERGDCDTVQRIEPTFPDAVCDP